LDPAQHLVLDLHQIARIEEGVLMKESVANILRARVGRPLLLEYLEPGIFVGHAILENRRSDP
jgi:hypothetical protein